MEMNGKQKLYTVTTPLPLVHLLHIVRQSSSSVILYTMLHHLDFLFNVPDADMIVDLVPDGADVMEAMVGLVATPAAEMAALLAALPPGG